MVAIIPETIETDFQQTLTELKAFTDIKNWQFVFLPRQTIEKLFDHFNTPYELNEHYYSEYAFIIDQELRLRGRKDDDDTTDGKLYGYNMRSVPILKNKMKDDIDIIYYQLKKTAEKEKRRKRKI